MRIEPIENPGSPLLKLAYWMSRRQLGRVMTPLKVIYARSPKLAMLAYRMNRVVEKDLTLDPELALLVETQSSLLNGCGFCADLHYAQVIQAKLGMEKFKALADFAASPHFSDAEKAALAYTEKITRREPVDDATFESLKKHFDERAIVELTWLNAVSNYYNLMAVPLGLESDGLEALAAARRG
jgi:AhpD family alkylhydroperoxidase